MEFFNADDSEQAKTPRGGVTSQRPKSNKCLLPPTALPKWGVERI